VKWVDRANEIYAQAGVHFEYNPKRDWSTMNSNLLIDVSLGRRVNELEEYCKVIERSAALYPNSIVVFIRNGWYGHFSSGYGNFVMLSNMGKDGPFDVFAHETGHYLGLPHTFGWVAKSVEDAARILKENNNDLNVFNGDGISDTLPDACFPDDDTVKGKDEVELNGQKYTIPRANIMSYYGAKDRLITPMQRLRVRWTLLDRQTRAMMPRQNGKVATPIEVTSLKVLDSAGCTTERQEVGDPYILSGKDMLVCHCTRGGRINLALPVKSAGMYRLNLYGALSSDYGKIQPLLDGKPLGQPVDGYAPLWSASGRITLGDVNLTAGDHTLSFQVVGRNVDSSGYNYAIDCLELAPVK
jgi:hypothetical protein